MYGASLLSCSSVKPIVLRSYIQAFIISPFLFCCSGTNLSSYSLTILLFLITFFLLWSFMPSSVGHVSFVFHLITISFLFCFASLASLFHELLGVGVTLVNWRGTNVSYVTRKLVPSYLWKSSFGLPTASRRIRFILSCEGWQVWLPACGLPHFPNHLKGAFPLCAWRQPKRLEQNTVISGRQILLISSRLNWGLQDCELSCTTSSVF